MPAIPLHRAAETVSATVTAMAKQGVNSARISLTPDSLGGIKVTLTQTDNGLVARVTAEHPEAAQALVQNAEDLRRSIEANGTTLLSLDIGSSGQPGAGSTGSGSQNFGSAAQGESSYGDLDADDEDGSTTTQLTVALSDGSLVDVLA